MRSRPVYVAIAIIALLTFAVVVSGALLSSSPGLGPSGGSIQDSFASPTQVPTREAAIVAPTATATSQPLARAEEPTAAPTTFVAALVEPTALAPSHTLRSPTPLDPPAPAPIAPPTVAKSAEPNIGGPVAVPNRHSGPRWVTLQVGHWNTNNLPEELQHLTDHTGAYAGGVSEVSVNEAVARLTAQRLFERGFSVDIIDATVPLSYTTDLFISLHADGNPRTSVRGFKAVAPWNAPPASDKFVEILYEEYGKATGLPTDAMSTDSMADYYAFNWRRYRHAVTRDVPGTLLEMGFVTNPEDRKVLTTQQESIAWGIANAVDRYFRSGAAGETPTPYPTFTPGPQPTDTPTNTPTPTSTPTQTPTGTPTPVPTEAVPGLTATAAVVTRVPPTRTPV
jgi:hypothetical protein